MKAIMVLNFLRTRTLAEQREVFWQTTVRQQLYVRYSMVTPNMMPNYGKSRRNGLDGNRDPREFGGLGLSYLELVVIAEELGRAAAPIPFGSWCTARALLAVGSQEQKENGYDDGGEAIGGALAEGNGRPSVSSLKTTFGWCGEWP